MICMETGVVVVGSEVGALRLLKRWGCPSTSALWLMATAAEKVGCPSS